jgi:hypothetical protein
MFSVDNHTILNYFKQNKIYEDYAIILKYFCITTRGVARVWLEKVDRQLDRGSWGRSETLHVYYNHPLRVLIRLQILIETTSLPSFT